MTDKQIKLLEKATIIYQKCCAVCFHIISLIMFIVNHLFNEGGTGGVWEEL